MNDNVDAVVKRMLAVIEESKLEGTTANEISMALKLIPNIIFTVEFTHNKEKKNV